MKLFLLTFYSIIAIQLLSFCQIETNRSVEKRVNQTENKTPLLADTIPLKNLKVSTIEALEIPKTNQSDVIITHTGFSLLYSETHEQAKWVAYDLTRNETTKLYERTDKFIIDPKVKTGSATAMDYEGSGYDRGHLAPASDMGWSSVSMAESFYYSNMSPQTPSFNRGIWKKLEELMRNWAVDYDTIYIVTGPVLSDGLRAIGPNKVSIPTYYYKVVLDYKSPNIKGIGFILPNLGSKEQLENYAVSIDSVENVTGIDFFPALDDGQEKLIEKTLCVECWTWNSGSIPGEKNKINTSESVQCQGNTNAGIRCKNKTLNSSGYCYHHEDQINSNNENANDQLKNQSAEPSRSNSTSVQCSGKTQAGNRCKRMTTSSNGRCYQH